MISNVLHWLGLPGKIVSVAVILFTAWHLRSGIKSASAIGSIIWVGIAGTFVATAAALLVPGISISIDPPTVMDAAGSAIQWGLDTVSSIMEVIPRGS